MDFDAIQRGLDKIYIDWKAALVFSNEDSVSLGPPLLLKATRSYCQAPYRVMFSGQETNGWQSNRAYRNVYPRYPHPWRYSTIETLKDFLECPDAVEALSWAYGQFDFAKHQPPAYRGPFWQAFREVQTWPGVGMLWNNLSKLDGVPSGSSAIVDDELRSRLLIQQSDLLRAEISLLKPHICLFFTGPFYDSLLSAAFPNSKLIASGDFSERQLACVADDLLPEASFRTYHPNHLARARKWNFINYLKEASFKREISESDASAQSLTNG